MINSIANTSVISLPATPSARNTPERLTPVDTSITAPHTAPRCPSVYVRWKGRNYRIYKKQAKNSATWYYSWYEHERRQMLNLETPTQGTAEITLKTFLEGQQRGLAGQMRALLEGSAAAVAINKSERPEDAGPALDRYLSLYESTPTGASAPETRRYNAQRIKNILTAASQPAHAPFAALLPALQTARQALNHKLEVQPSQTRQLSMKRTWNTNVRMALSVFCDGALAALDKQMTVPATSLIALRTGGKKVLFPNVSKSIGEYRPPTQTILASTLEAWLKLERNEFCAVGLALSCALRRREIEQAQWSWFAELDGYVFLDAAARVKNHSGEVRTRALEPFYSIFRTRCQAEGWWPGEGSCLEGVLPYARNRFDRNVSEWMQDLGWKTRLHLHALRAWAGSLVYTRYGVEAACSFCRHEDESTTRTHYGWLRDRWAETGKAIFVIGKPVEWAKI